MGSSSCYSISQHCIELEKEPSGWITLTQFDWVTQAQFDWMTSTQSQSDSNEMGRSINQKTSWSKAPAVSPGTKYSLT